MFEKCSSFAHTGTCKYSQLQNRIHCYWRKQLIYPGGHFNWRPPKTWRWRWKTDWPANRQTKPYICCISLDPFCIWGCKKTQNTEHKGGTDTRLKFSGTMSNGHSWSVVVCTYMTSPLCGSKSQQELGALLNGTIMDEEYWVTPSSHYSNTFLNDGLNYSFVQACLQGWPERCFEIKIHQYRWCSTHVHIQQHCSYVLEDRYFDLSPKGCFGKHDQVNIT